MSIVCRGSDCTSSVIASYVYHHPWKVMIQQDRKAEVIDGAVRAEEEGRRCFPLLIFLNAGELS